MNKKREPYFIKKRHGIGLNINPKNIWGTITYIILSVIIIIGIIQLF
jgi:uncharacterized membrane protein